MRRLQNLSRPPAPGPSTAQPGGQTLVLQLLLATAGILLLGGLLANQALSRKTVMVPDAGGTYVEGVAGYVRAVNPLVWQSEAERDLVSLIFEGLVRFDGDGNVVPNLARQWTISEDGLTYTFELRDDVVWQDGEPFTSGDVAFTVRAIQDPAYKAHPELAKLWQDIQVTEAGPHTVRFSLDEPYAPFLAHLTLGILPAHLLRDTPVAELETAPFSVNPVGTGPFRLASLDGQQATLVPNLQYRGRRPYLDQVQFKFYDDTPSLLAAFKRGEIQGTTWLGPADGGGEAANGRGNIYSSEASACTVVFLNLNRQVLKDKEVRQALMLALDRRALVDQVAGGQAVVANSPIISALWASRPTLERYRYDPAEAAKLLDAAGWLAPPGGGIRTKGPLKLALSLVTNSDPIRSRLVDAIAERWRALGIQVDTQVVEPSRLAEDFLRPRHFDAALYGWNVPYLDPDPYPLWHSTQANPEGQNYTGFSNPEADAILEQARRTIDPATRAMMYARFQEIFADELPALPLFQSVSQYLIDPSVRDVQVGRLVSNPADRFQTIASWYMKTRREIVAK